MKFALPTQLRRAGDSPEVEDGPPAPPRPPRGRPVSAYAGILDGRTLWLAVDAAPGSLALRDTASGDVLALRSDVAEDKPAYRSVRVDLTDLPPATDPAASQEASYDVVLVPSGGRPPKAVWTHPLTAGGPVRVPVAPGGTTRFALHRTEDGTLQVLRIAVAPSVGLRAIEEVPGGVRVHLADPAVGDLLLLGDGEVLASFPLTTDETGSHATVTVTGLPDAVDGFADVAIGSPGTWLRVTRERNDLAQPNRGVMLPVLHGDDPDRPRLRFRYDGDARLVVRLLAPGTDPQAGQEASA